MSTERDENTQAETGAQTSRVGVDADVMRQVLDEVKQWDIRNLMQHGGYKLPRRLRLRVQQALGETAA